MLSVDLTDATVRDEATLLTEATWVFRPLGGNLYVPYIDPREGIGNPEDGQYAVASAPGVWTVDQPILPYGWHVMDVAETSEGLWLFGLADAGAAVWKSTDSGATWAADLIVAPTGEGNQRFYAVLTFGDEMLAVIDGWPDPPQTWHRLSGGTWTEITATTPVSDGVPFTYGGTPYWLCRDVAKQDGKAAAGSGFHAWVRPADSGDLAAIQATLPDTPCRDVAVSADGQHAYVLAVGKLWRGDTTGVWTEILQWSDTTVHAVSLAVDEDNGYLYVGTTDSRVLRTPIPT